MKDLTVNTIQRSINKFAADKIWYSNHLLLLVTIEFFIV